MDLNNNDLFEKRGLWQASVVVLLNEHEDMSLDPQILYKLRWKARNKGPLRHPGQSVYSNLSRTLGSVTDSLSHIRMGR